ncbi:MAG: class I SAM-dependent methyltransferase [Alphaproteobacteria bacterium]|nr:class I SAM-dependent methyltransferase [Alphaproteobacteria bacterium]
MISSLLYSLRSRAFVRILKHLRFGELTVTMPDGSTHHVKAPEDGPVADLTIHSQRALGRIMSDGKMGFCEAFMQGEVTSGNLTNLIELTVKQNDYVEENLKFSVLKTYFRQIMHWLNSNSKTGSRKNISYHYDLGNSFYDKWLDKSMTYSSAYFERDDDDLKTAQESKYRRLAEMVDLTPGDHVLEIGCGWGGFAEYAARHFDVRITAITISKEQFDYANARIAAAGLSDKVTISLTDYRDLNQTYDKIVSIEMFEAVGEAYWPTYFETVARCLQNNGKAALQVITIDDRIFDDYKREPDFIQQYIFPGGMLPSVPRLANPLKSAGLKLVQENGFGLHYARTLQEWRDRFLDSWPEISTSGFDARFKRMWELYLAYCEGGFRAGSIDVKHMLLERADEAISPAAAE